MSELIFWAGLACIIIGIPAAMMMAAWDIAKWIIYGGDDDDRSLLE